LMADALDFLRQDALRKRISGIAGGNRVVWSAKDMVTIHDHVMSVRPEHIIRATQPTEVKSSEPVNLSNLGIEVRSDAGLEDHPVCIITTPRADLANDSVNGPGIDSADFAKFCAVLDAHDSSKPPVAVSSRPWQSGDNMLAIARFPKPGVSADSDRIAAAVRAGLQRGTSIGFIPLKWSFSKDPARPLGVDFSAIKLLEWSLCGIPCNQDCRVVGWVSGATSSPDASKMAALRREARALAAKGRSICAAITDAPPQTREQRLADARSFRRAADLAGRS
jgi:hypothetical protein